MCKGRPLRDRPHRIPGPRGPVRQAGRPRSHRFTRQTLTPGEITKSLRHTLAALVITAAALLSGFFSGPAAGAMSDYLENKLVDYVFRGQAYTAPTTVLSPSPPLPERHRLRHRSHRRLLCPGGRHVVPGQLGGTQSAGSTTASTGTSGTISNNAAITFPAPTANWGTVVEYCVFDASTAGNLLFRAALTTSKTINNGDAAPASPPAPLTFQADN